jgi:hypothetical protein
VEQIQSVANKWNETKDAKNSEEKCIAPYFCFIQSSGMGKTKLMYEFAQLTRNDPSFENLGCDLILSGDMPLGKEVAKSDVFDFTLDLQSFVTDTGKKASTVAENI